MTPTEIIIAVNAAIDLAIRLINVARRERVMTPEELAGFELRLRDSLRRADEVTPR